MTWLVLFLIVGLLVVLIGYQRSQRPPQPLDPEEAMRATIELHRISRRLDVARLKHEQRCDAARSRREIAEALEPDGD